MKFYYIIIFINVYWLILFYIGYRLVNNIKIDSNIIYKESWISVYTEPKKILKGGSMLKRVTIILTKNNVILKTFPLFAYEMKRKGLLKKINYKNILKISKKNNYILIFFKEFNEIEKIYILSENTTKLYDILIRHFQK